MFTAFLKLRFTQANERNILHLNLSMLSSVYIQGAEVAWTWESRRRLEPTYGYLHSLFVCMAPNVYGRAVIIDWGRKLLEVAWLFSAAHGPRVRYPITASLWRR